MSKTYQYSGLTPELYQRLVCERAALKEAHPRDYKHHFQKSKTVQRETSDHHFASTQQCGHGASENLTSNCR